MQKLMPALIGFKSIPSSCRFTPLLADKANLVLKKCQMSSSSSDTANELREASVPNETWSEKTVKLYNELMDLCKDGEWEKVTSFQNFTGNERLFVRAVQEKGKMFEYAMFLNKKEERMRAVVQFGPWLQGPKGAVHGGAIATMFDSVSGVLTYQLGYRCVTVNLNVNFHGMVPLYETVLFEAWLKKKEGKKIYIEAALTSVDGQDIYDTCSSLWIDMNAHVANLDTSKMIEAKY